jgi:putative hydrolase of the HAD superfamily
LFDLDETLVVEERAVVAAFEATAQYAAAQRPLDAATLAVVARARARELWRGAPTHAYCARIGISSWEGLWCRFEGSEPETASLRAWSPTFRREAWRIALADQGIEDPCLAEGLAERFGGERRARYEVYSDAAAALTELGEAHPLALVTNGASCLQREKLATSGLAPYFDAVVVSAEVGVGKPDAAIFRYALAELGADGEGAVMIGDSLVRDIEGAIAAGLDAVWLNRPGVSDERHRGDVVEIATLAALPMVLRALP